MYDIENTTSLITGGTRGIGLAIAEALLAAGGNVVINGRSATIEGDELIAQHGPTRVTAVYADVSDPSAATRIVEQAAETSGRLDVLVHAAGSPAPGRISELKTDNWMDAFAVHVHPVFHLFRAAHPHLVKKGGAVLLISSVAGIRGCPGTVAYQTVKGALIPLAKALAFDHGPENIRVNLLVPGIIRTRFHEAMSEVAKAHNIGARIPLRREGVVEDVASAAMQMLTNEFITGETLVIDGGMSMRVTG